MSVTAVDWMGLSTSVVEAILLDWSLPVVGNLTFPWSSRELPVTNATTAIVELVGGAYDDESEVDLSWDTFAMDGGVSPLCTVVLESRSSYRIDCAQFVTSQFVTLCVNLVVTNQARLSSSTSACLIMDLIQPEFSVTPTAYVRDGQLRATWPSPHHSNDVAPVVEWAVCTTVACSNVSSISTSNLSVSLTHPTLQRFTGAVWINVQAVSTAGRHSLTVSSNCVWLGATPALGSVSLSPVVSLADIRDAVISLESWELPMCGAMMLEWCLGTQPGFDDLLPCVNVSWTFGTPTAISIREHEARLQVKDTKWNTHPCQLHPHALSSEARAFFCTIL